MKRRIYLFVLGLTLLGVMHPASAATLNFGKFPATVPPSATTTIPILFSSGQAKVNTISGQLVFTNLEDVAISDGNSFVSLWVERPTAKNQYHFAGVIPGGIAIDHGLLFNLIVKPRAQTQVSVSDVQVLLNDGVGTAVEVGTIKTTVSVNTRAAAPSATADEEAPEPFKPVISHDPNIFEGKPFLSFATQDKNSGIDFYEVAESSRSINLDSIATADLTWQRADSPYLLSDEAAEHFVYVKAVDRAGNVRVAVVEPATIHFDLYHVAVVFAILIGMVILWWAIRRRTKSLVILLALLCAPLFTHAATLRTTAPQTDYDNGQTFTLQVVASSPSEALNAVSGTLNFPTDKLQVVSVSKSNSILNFWVSEPSFSNIAGTVHFEGVALNPGYTGSNGRVISVQFRAIGEGAASLTLSGASILANDGEGTEVLSSATGVRLNILHVEKKAPAPAATSTATTTPTPVAPAPTPEVVSRPPVVIEGTSHLNVLIQVAQYYIGQPTILWSIIVVLLVFILMLLVILKEQREMIAHFEERIRPISRKKTKVISPKVSPRK